MKLAIAFLSPLVLLSGSAQENMMRSIPLHFEPNVGQADSKVRFAARGGGMSIFLTGDETVLARPGEDPVRMKLRGGKRAEFEALDKLPGVSNYYRGNDPKKWREGVPHYARVRAKSVYEGVDIVYYGSERRLEYDFVVAPGADPSKIELAYEGTRSMRVDSDGNLVLATRGGELRQKRPVVYQEVDGQRLEVAAKYRIAGPAVRFELAKYDVERPLVIDPILEYGTLLGGLREDAAHAIAVDRTGSIFLAGYTYSIDFPQSAPRSTELVHADAVVAGLNPAGSALTFVTFLAGNEGDRLHGVALDGSGNIFVAGESSSTDFPILNALQSTRANGFTDGTVARLSPAGLLSFSTYLGGDGQDIFTSIAVNSNGLYLAGETLSSSLLGLTGPARRGILVRLTPNGSGVVYARSLAGAESFTGMTLDSSGDVYLTGRATGIAATPGAVSAGVANENPDAFVAKLSANGSQWIYVAVLGGARVDYGQAVVVDSVGRAFVTGTTNSDDFPVRNAYDAQLGAGNKCCEDDVFVASLDATGATLRFSTFLGGDDREFQLSMALDGADAVVAGLTDGAGFPLLNSWRNDPSSGGFLAKVSSSGGLVFSSLFGPPGTFPRAVAVSSGLIYLTGGLGWTIGQVPPDSVTQGAFDTTANGNSDIFVARFSSGPAPVPITGTSTPVGRSILVDGFAHTTPATFSWQPGTRHSIEAINRELTGQTILTFSSWSNGGSRVQILASPTVASTYTATYSVSQCSYSFSPSQLESGFEGLTRRVYVNTEALCRWTPVSSAGWLSMSTPAGLQSSAGSIDLTVQPNLGRPRTGTISAGGAVLTVLQAGAGGAFPAPRILAPSGGDTVRTKSTRLAWTPVAGASRYEVRVFKQFTCEPCAPEVLYFGSQDGQSSASTNIDLPDGRYSMYVRACQPGPGSANCGDSGAVDIVVDQAVPEAIPVITSPRAGQVLTTSTNLISWEPVPGATSYEVILGGDRRELHINTPTPWTVFTMKSSAIYFLEVRACSAKCAQYQYASLQFRVQLPPVPQTAPTGLAARITNGNNLDLAWNSVTNADLYRVQVVQPTTGPGGGALTVAAKQVSAANASLQVPAGVATAVVNACNGDGCGPAATLLVNPTGPNPSLPIIATPMPVVVADGPSVTISWSRIAGDDGSNTDYRLYVGDLSRDGPALDVITKNNFYGAYLRAEGRRYDALVFATQNGTTVTGPASGFMVGGASATAPLITSPTHNSTFKQGSFRLAWSPIPRAIRYQYYVVKEGAAVPVLTGVTPGLFVDTQISASASTSHHSIVRACDLSNWLLCTPDSDAGWGPWSNKVTGTTNFTIIP